MDYFKTANHSAFSDKRTERKEITFCFSDQCLSEITSYQGLSILVPTLERIKSCKRTCTLVHCKTAESTPPWWGKWHFGVQSRVKICTYD